MNKLLSSSIYVFLTVAAGLIAGPAFDLEAEPRVRMASAAAPAAKDPDAAAAVKVQALEARSEKACVDMQMTCNSTVTGVLDTTDCQLGDLSRIDFWEFQADAGTRVTVSMSSNEFDTFLFLLSPLPESVTLALDDDSGPSTDSRLESSLDETGVWAIGANGFDASELGNYTLQLQCSPGTPMAPAAPSNLGATALSSTEVEIQWNDNSDNEREFLVELRSPGTGFVEIGQLSAFSTAAEVMNLDPGTAYDFRVRARNLIGPSGYSNVASATTPGGEVEACEPSPTNLCLLDDRFKVEVDWENFEGMVGQGMVVPFGSADSGLFYFFNADNWEMLVKMVDACGTEFDSFWVFAAATTNVEYTLRVTDTDTGVSETYFNPLGNAAPAITDTAAFFTCP